MNKMNYELFLRQNLITMQVVLSKKAQCQLIEFLFFLKKWNRAYNLTAITDLQQMITHHVLDSLSIMNYLKGNRMVDVGSGAGFPGIPLAIACPDKQFVLIDSVGKKTRFMNQAIRHLNLSNVIAVQTRALQYPTAGSFDTMMARAVGSINYLMPIAKHLLCKSGRLLIMTSDTQYNAQVIPLSVPGVQSPRSLVVIDF